MKYITIEKIWEKFPNKYEALVKAAKEARRVIDALEKNEIQLEEDPYRYALKHTLEQETPDKKEEKTES
jgi:DNA-directed RNA polymerase subunit K/omega